MYCCGLHPTLPIDEPISMDFPITDYRAICQHARDGEPAGLRRDIVDELGDHLAALYTRELLRGVDASSARQRVLQRFGDPAAVARRLWLDAMKRKIMASTVSLFAACLVTLASLSLAGHDVAANNPGPRYIRSRGSGGPPRDGPAEREGSVRSARVAKTVRRCRKRSRIRHSRLELGDLQAHRGNMLTDRPRPDTRSICRGKMRPGAIAKSSPILASLTSVRSHRATTRSRSTSSGSTATNMPRDKSTFNRAARPSNGSSVPRSRQNACLCTSDVPGRPIFEKEGLVLNTEFALQSRTLDGLQWNLGDIWVSKQPRSPRGSKAMNQTQPCPPIRSVLLGPGLMSAEIPVGPGLYFWQSMGGLSAEILETELRPVNKPVAAIQWERGVYLLCRLIVLRPTPVQDADTPRKRIDLLAGCFANGFSKTAKVYSPPPDTKRLSMFSAGRISDSWTDVKEVEVSEDYWQKLAANGLRLVPVRSTSGRSTCPTS